MRDSWAFSVQSSISCIFALFVGPLLLMAPLLLPPAIIFWLDTTHWDWGTSPPTAPPNTVL